MGIKSLIFVPSFFYFLWGQGDLCAQQASRMSQIQYARFLDDLEGSLPAVSIRVASLCGARPAYGLTPEVSNSIAEALDSCKEIVPGILKNILDNITLERRSPKLSTEYVMEYELRGVIQAAGDASRLSTRGVSRGEEAMAITEKLQPLDLQLYSHVLAMLREWDGPPSK